MQSGAGDHVGPVTVLVRDGARPHQMAAGELPVPGKRAEDGALPPRVGDGSARRRSRMRTARR
jgi:hypothetical protein